MPKSNAAHDYSDLIGGIGRLELARPALDALADVKGPVRRGDLAVTLVAERRKAVHSRTLSNALRFLANAGLIIRREHETRNVVYEATSLGRDLRAALNAADRVARKHQRRRKTDPGSSRTKPTEPG